MSLLTVPTTISTTAAVFCIVTASPKNATPTAYVRQRRIIERASGWLPDMRRLAAHKGFARPLTREPMTRTSRSGTWRAGMSSTACNADAGNVNRRHGSAPPITAPGA